MSHWRSLWKNGIVTQLSTYLSVANAITVLNGDVYVAGAENISGISYATYWKNGAATHLGSGSAAYAVTVVAQ